MSRGPDAASGAVQSGAAGSQRTEGRYGLRWADWQAGGSTGVLWAGQHTGNSTPGREAEDLRGAIGLASAGQRLETRADFVRTLWTQVPELKRPMEVSPTLLQQ